MRASATPIDSHAPAPVFIQTSATDELTPTAQTHASSAFFRPRAKKFSLYAGFMFSDSRRKNESSGRRFSACGGVLPANAGGRGMALSLRGRVLVGRVRGFLTEMCPVTQACRGEIR